jgi:hypothetical protein
VAIEELIAFIPPPDTPQDADGDWSAAEAALSVRFPNDFRQLIRRYGTGEFYAGLLIFNPLNSWCLHQIAKQLKNYHAMREAMELSLRLHPESPGLFPWGFDSNGNGFFWLTDGEPDQWPVVQVGHNEEENPHQADVGITTFLVRYGRHEYPEMLGGIRFKKKQLRFTPGLAWEQ